MLDQAYLAALALVTIQVAMGVLFKSIQHQGSYTFSISASIAISEFLKFSLSTVLFYRTCRNRRDHAAAEYNHVEHTSEPHHDPKQESHSLEEMNVGQDGRTSIEVEEAEVESKLPARHVGLFTFIWYFKNDIPRQTAFGFGQLALLYATINNTVFVLFELADPGTIQLIKSGITLVTAVVLYLTLGTKIARLQWVAILFQVCGICVTQYHPGSGTTYPITTYAMLFFQTFASAIAGVYNQHLCKSSSASLHAQNMVLYAFGVGINTVIYTCISTLKKDEPAFFHGFDNIGAILVLLSSVLNGLIMTAVYKYADAVIKCLATAVSTVILLLLSTILFGAEFSVLIIPGTIVVLTATWLYMDSTPPKSAASAQDPLKPYEESRPSTFKRVLTAFTPKGNLAILGFVITMSLAVANITTLNLWKAHSSS